MDGMQDEGVSHVRRITTFRDGQRRDTSLLVLTFSSTRLPPKVTCGYLIYDIKPFIPNPLRCYTCQRFGHGKNSCKDAALCARCAQPAHEGTPCQSPQKCINCKSNDHTADSKDCPIWKKEKRVCEVKVHRDITYKEARNAVETETEKTPNSFAQIAAKKTASSETQTDPIPQLQPLKLLPPLKPTSLTAPRVQTTQSAQTQKTTPRQSSANSGAIPRNTSRGRSPARKENGHRSQRERSSHSHVRSRSPKNGSDQRQARWSSSSRPPPSSRGDVGPPVGQGQLFS